MSEQENLNPPVNYDLSFLKKPKWIFIYGLLFLIIIISKIPLASKFDKIITKAMIISPSCQLQMTDYGFHLFPLPHVRVTNLNVPGQCMGPGKPSILLGEVRAYFRGPSFSPFGFLLKLETQYEKIPLEFYLTAGTSKFTVVMKDNLIPLDKLSKLIPNLKMTGQVKTDIFAEATVKGLHSININLQSKTFVIPGQQVTVVPVPLLNFQDLHFIATLDNKNHLKIQKLVLGNENSPIRTELTGTITLANVPGQIHLNVKGQLALSDEILKDPMFSLIEQQVLKTFDKEDKFYQIQFNDTLATIMGKMGLGSMLRGF